MKAVDIVEAGKVSGITITSPTGTGLLWSVQVIVKANT